MLLLFGKMVIAPSAAASWSRTCKQIKVPSPCLLLAPSGTLVFILVYYITARTCFFKFFKFGAIYMFRCPINRTFERVNPTLLKKLFMWFQWIGGSKKWPNNTVDTKFCVQIFFRAHKSQPPKKYTVSHCANGPGWPLWQANYLLSMAISTLYFCICVFL